MIQHHACFYKSEFVPLTGFLLPEIVSVVFFLLSYLYLILISVKEKLRPINFVIILMITPVTIPTQWSNESWFDFYSSTP